MNTSIPGVEQELLMVQDLLKARPEKRFVIGFSGGVDSSLLLDLLASAIEDRSRILAVHVNHELNASADDWQQHCQQQCEQRDVPFIARKVTLEKIASTEDAARRARFQVFEEVLQEDDVLLLGHHMNDQAETVIFRLLRGSGVDGLAGIAPERTWTTAKGVSVQVVRPLLEVSRQDIETEADRRGIDWIHDDSNEDPGFDRNFIRGRVLPIMEERWPGAVERISSAASLLGEASGLLADLALVDLETCGARYQDVMYGSVEVLEIKSLGGLSAERQANLLRYWLKAGGFTPPGRDLLGRIVSEVCEAREDAGPRLCWADNMISRFQGYLFVVTALPDIDAGKVYTPDGLDTMAAETGIRVYLPEYWQGRSVQLRFRSGGERLSVNGKTRPVKKLLQEKKVLPWLRDRVPLLYEGEDLLLVCGLPASLFGLPGEATVPVTVV